MLLDMIASRDEHRQRAGEPRALVTWIVDEAAASLLPSSEGAALTRNPPRLDAEPSAPVGYEEEDLTRGHGEHDRPEQR